MKTNLKFYHGIIIFVCMMILFVTVGGTLQYLFGIYGLAMSELLLLLIAVTAASVLHCDFREVFPLTPPPVPDFLAALVLFAGAYFLDLASLIVIEQLFPAIGEFGESITLVGTSVSPFMSVLIIAGLPAVCEEALHRGILLSCFKHIKNKAAVIAISGLLFGLFHLDPYRLIPTAILGCALAYIALTTDSMLLTMILHFLNNLTSVIAMWSVSDSVDSLESVEAYGASEVYAGAAVYAVIGAVLIGAGLLLFRKNRRAKENAGK